MQRVRVSSQQAPVHKLGDSQIGLSPKFRLALLDEMDLWGEYPPQCLIPGLPDDVALNCLVRVPVDSHISCRSVCKRWNAVFGTKQRFFMCRKELGFSEPWLFVLAFEKCSGKVEWKVLDLTRFSWHTIPAMPCASKDRVCLHGFRCVSIPRDGLLFVVSDLVLRYEVTRNRWTVMKKMVTARSFFGAGVIDGMIYAAGGNSSSLFELDSAEVFDPRGTASWRSVAAMPTNMASYDAAVLDRKLLVTEGWFWPFYVAPRGHIYDPATDRWETMPAGLREGWTGSSVVILDHLFVVSEHERTKLKVYDAGSDSWEAVEGPALPHQICKPFSVSSSDSRIFVVGRSLHAAVGFISGSRSPFSVAWQVVQAPQNLSDLTPSSAQLLLA